MKRTFTKLFSLSFFLCFLSCTQSVTRMSFDNDAAEKNILVYNFDNEVLFNKYQQMNLDDTHPNLLNPQISQSDYSSVVHTWTELHNSIGNYLYENDFDWGTKDSTINILHKIYFNKDGKIKAYFFRVMNPDIEEESKTRYAQLLTDFAKTTSIDLKKNEDFAQCGKTKYMNKEKSTL